MSNLARWSRVNGREVAWSGCSRVRRSHTSCPSCTNILTKSRSSVGSQKLSVEYPLSSSTGPLLPSTFRLGHCTQLISKPSSAHTQPLHTFSSMKRVLAGFESPSARRQCCPAPKIRFHQAFCETFQKLHPLMAFHGPQTPAKTCCTHAHSAMPG